MYPKIWVGLADATERSDAVTTQRVYEYVVEPAALQKPSRPRPAARRTRRGRPAAAGGRVRFRDRRPAQRQLPSPSTCSPGQRRPASASRARRLVSIGRSAVRTPLPVPDAATGGPAPTAGPPSRLTPAGGQLGAVALSGGRSRSHFPPGFPFGPLHCGDHSQVAPFPAPAASNRACGSPAHGSPTPFTAGIRPCPPVPEGSGVDDDS